MLIRPIFISAILLLFFISSCKPPIKPEHLYGKWKYLKIEHPNANPPDTVSSGEIKENFPYIQFKQNGDLLIVWRYRILSHGKFTVDNQDIIYREVLPDGKIRQFPFWVSELTDKQIVFQTIGAGAAKVTAVKK
jgi:hypothetical protein